MGRAKREQPNRIGEKVRDIRLKLELTQEAMYNALVEQGVKVHLGYVSLYEIGERVPSLLVTLAYARIAGISTDVLIDDELDLPDKLYVKKKR
jgi:transcriptional regulator with XRE-family HTH domain